MKFDLNKLSFICLHTSGGNLYPPQDAAKELDKENVLGAWEDYLRKDYADHKKIGFYMHTPFCEAKCIFCSCGSEKILGGNTLNEYLERMISEMDFFSPLFDGIQLDHAYFGGGTPSIYNEEQLELLLSTIRKLFAFKQDAQWNFEVSPHTITEEKIGILKKHGISRITVGIQTMTAKSLEFNGRIQTWEKLTDVIGWIRKYDIPHINVDIMPGIPGENLKDFLLNLKRIIDLGPDMIHLYPFRPTEETPFFKKGFKYTREEINSRDVMYQLGMKLIEKSGFYGVKNDSWGRMDAARNDQEVDKIVNNCSILGFGYPTRSYAHKNLMYFTGFDMYKTQNPVYFGIKMDKSDYVARYCISHFRNGFSISDINEKFGIDFLNEYGEEIKFLQANNILQIQDNFFKTRISNVFEKLIFSKVFYSDENISLILQKYKYDHSQDYIGKFRDTLSISYK